MAGPHVAGVAALYMSQFGEKPWWAVAAKVEQSADRIDCPDAATLALYEPFPSESNRAPPECQGRSRYNSWYGYGQANALSAVMRSPWPHNH